MKCCEKGKWAELRLRRNTWPKLKERHTWQRVPCDFRWYSSCDPCDRLEENHQTRAGLHWNTLDFDICDKMLVSVLVILLSYAQPKDSRTLDMFAKTSTSPQVVRIQKNKNWMFYKNKARTIKVKTGTSVACLGTQLIREKTHNTKQLPH